MQHNVGYHEIPGVGTEERFGQLLWNLSSAQVTILGTHLVWGAGQITEESPKCSRQEEDEKDRNE